MKHLFFIAALFLSFTVFGQLNPNTPTGNYTISNSDNSIKIADNTKEITRLKMLKLNCVECDTTQIGKKIFELKNEKNKLVNYTKIWTPISK